MNAYVFPAKKKKEDLATEIEFVSANPVVSGLLHSVSGVLAVLDENRQILAVNDSFLQMLGIDEPEQALGLRPGEALHCIYQDNGHVECGATDYCSTCGAAIAIVASLGEDKPAERLCALSCNKDGRLTDLALLVRSQPIRIDKKRYLLLFLQDISEPQQKAALERAFYHDVNNLLTMLVSASELLVKEDSSKLAKTIHQGSFRLFREISMQQCLTQDNSSTFQPMWREFLTEQIFEELQIFFENHPAAYKRKIEYFNQYPGLSIKTDISLLSRVLSNMVINALEATEKKGVVKVWLERDMDSFSFCVWNAHKIPKSIAKRIFQRNFSTKKQAGRGIGTYSMKLFGENILGGRVSFTSTKDEGTIFRFTASL